MKRARLITSILLVPLGASSACSGDAPPSGPDTGADGTTTNGPGSTEGQTDPSVGSPPTTTSMSTGGADDTGSGSSGEPAPLCEDGDVSALVGAPLHEQLAALRSGTICCSTLRAATVAQIERMDPDGINAVLSIDEQAAAHAQRLDAVAADAPLHCALVMVKDNIDMAGVATTAGSLALVDNVVEQDAPLIARLRDSGALPLGKTNLSEWANFRGYGSISGWSSLGGQTTNARSAEHSPCGSSSGSAAVVAAGMVPAALGSETNGSIVCPSSINGVVGFKPTWGLVSRTGVVPIAYSGDMVGPITRSVRDAALLLSAMAGADPEDASTETIPADFDFDFVAGLDAASLAGRRFGTAQNYLELMSPEVQELYAQQREALTAAGVEIVEIEYPDDFGVGSDYYRVMLHEFKVGVADYLVQRGAAGVPKSLAELIAFNEANADTVMPYFGQEVFYSAEDTAGLDSPTYLASLDLMREQAGAQGLLALLDGEQLDAIVLPTQDPAWLIDYENGDAFGASTSTLAAAAGYPHLTIPMGDVEGLPVGLSFIGRPWDDKAVLELGYAYEQLE